MDRESFKFLSLHKTWNSLPFTWFPFPIIVCSLINLSSSFFSFVKNIITIWSDFVVGTCVLIVFIISCSVYCCAIKIDTYRLSLSLRLYYHDRVFFNLWFPTLGEKWGRWITIFHSVYLPDGIIIMHIKIFANKRNWILRNLIDRELSHDW